ncbi:MAG TPA: peptidase U32 family protein [Prolixibacteraceae bacterium]|nr:peptidase U32 family protein [Prolixibacteraceae bacterium]
MTKKPELLAPVGNTESFYAALNGGADAIYLGLPEFNARNRASNFTRPMLQLAVSKAHEKKVKVYITLNTLIKNKEIDQLIDVLSFLVALRVDAVIIQDWGVYQIAHRFFPKLVIHASTQMGIHNSVGVNFNTEKGFHRTVLARELTMPELSKISKSSQSELELFIHGALCYSFSGMCLYSSFVGGQGANRGLCKQSCRRVYSDSGENHALFSLKDNQQLENLEKIMELGIHSLKIEGRMKSADYVYQVCKAYRMAIDNPQNIKLASEMLDLDTGREKTSYFLGRDVKDAITEDVSTGKLIGKILEAGKKLIIFESSIPLEEGYRLRVRNGNEEDQLYIKVENFSNTGSIYKLPTDLASKIKAGDEVLLVRLKSQSFSSRLGNVNTLPELKRPNVNKNEIKNSLVVPTKNNKPQLLVRIGSPAWIVKLRFEDYDAVILSFKKSDWEKFDVTNPVYLSNLHKIHVELPKFISEGNLDFYRKLTHQLAAAGFSQFFISHLSQKALLPSNARISANENIYVLNDGAVKTLAEEKINTFIYPQENDLENLLSMKNKQGVIPLYFYPQLFYSRMPVKNRGEIFADETNKKFRIAIKDGITIVYPTIPVALLHHRELLEKNGFNRFLIDYTGEIITANVVKRILKKYLDKEAVQPSAGFNFKLGLK